MIFNENDSTKCLNFKCRTNTNRTHTNQDFLYKFQKLINKLYKKLLCSIMLFTYFSIFLCINNDIISFTRHTYQCINCCWMNCKTIRCNYRHIMTFKLKMNFHSKQTHSHLMLQITLPLIQVGNFVMHYYQCAIDMLYRIAYKM